MTPASLRSRMRPSVLLSIALLLLAILGGGCDPLTDDRLGDPCIPPIENDPAFLGFDKREVSFAGTGDCPGVCLVNHFQGRVGCPYGQDTNGAPHPSAPGAAPGRACTTPAGTEVGVSDKREVLPQCMGRTVSATVYCSCRCANAFGRTDDGANYCACSAGFECAQLVYPIPGQANLTGGYCMKKATAFKESDCDSECVRSGDARTRAVCGD